MNNTFSYSRFISPIHKYLLNAIPFNMTGAGILRRRQIKNSYCTDFVLSITPNKTGFPTAAAALSDISADTNKLPNL